MSPETRRISTEPPLESTRALPRTSVTSTPPPLDEAITSPSTSITVTPPPELLAVTAPAIDSTSTPPPELRASTAVRRGTVTTTCVRPQPQFHRNGPDPLRSTSTSSRPGRLSSSRTSNFCVKSSRSELIVTVAVSPSTPRTSTPPASDFTRELAAGGEGELLLEVELPGPGGRGRYEEGQQADSQRSSRAHGSLLVERQRSGGREGFRRARVQRLAEPSKRPGVGLGSAPVHPDLLFLRRRQLPRQRPGAAQVAVDDGGGDRRGRATSMSHSARSTSLRSLCDAVRAAIRVSSGLAAAVSQASPPPT
jgi:hypothetical protein